MDCLRKGPIDPGLPGPIGCLAVDIGEDVMAEGHRAETVDEAVHGVRGSDPDEIPRQVVDYAVDRTDALEVRIDAVAHRRCRGEPELAREDGKRPVPIDMRSEGTHRNGAPSAEVLEVLAQLEDVRG